MAVIPFNKDFPYETGEVVTLTPRIRRVTCPNPSSFTFHGTNTYILGHGKVGIVDPGPAEKAHTDRLREVLNKGTAEDRKAFVDRFGVRPADLPASRFAEAEDWLSDLEVAP